MKLILPSPLQKIHLNDAFGELYIKRDDQIHPLLSGNKWRKLKGLVQQFKAKTLLTFGGAFSNHLVAVAYYAMVNNLHSIGVIRGNELNSDNPTLALCAKLGMTFNFLDRESYRNQTKLMAEEGVKFLKDQLLIPEGGSTEFVKIGMGELVAELKIFFDSSQGLDIYCSYGTGGTATGISHNLSKNDSLTIIPAIKGLTKLKYYETASLLGCEQNNVSIKYYPEFKRYAAKDIELFKFCESFFKEKNVLLDPIYTSKVMFYLTHYAEKKTESKSVFIHSGGIQAWNGFFYRFPELKSELPEIYSEIQRLCVINSIQN